MNIQYVIELKQGNLVLEEDVDFIVNASNTSLVLGSGVSMAFTRHCGRELQVEMNELLVEIRKTGYLLKKGDVIPSSSGLANNFKHALHVVTVDSNPGVHFMEKNPTLSDIDKGLLNIEKVIVEYAKLHNRTRVSIVLPMLGCGVGGLSKKEVIEKYDQFFTSRVNENSEIICRAIVYGHNESDMGLLTDKLLCPGL